MEAYRINCPIYDAYYKINLNYINYIFFYLTK